MSGSPAAGKTEVAKSLAEVVSGDSDDPVIRLDPDDYREMIPDYEGSKSHYYQASSSTILNACFDLVIRERLTFIFDSTLSDFERAKSNIQRCLDKQYKVIILFVCQDALIAWETAKMREIIEGRAVPMESFIDRYFGARETVNKLKDTFGKIIQIDLLMKDIETGKRSFEFNVNNIDSFVPENYTPASLRKRILEK